jgi:hypothetical protein
MEYQNVLQAQLFSSVMNIKTISKHLSSKQIEDEVEGTKLLKMHATGRSITIDLNSLPTEMDYPHEQDEKSPDTEEIEMINIEPNINAEQTQSVVQMLNKYGEEDEIAVQATGTENAADLDYSDPSTK